MKQFKWPVFETGISKFESKPLTLYQTDTPRISFIKTREWMKCF